MGVRRHMDERAMLLKMLTADKGRGVSGVPGFKGRGVPGFHGEGMDPMMGEGFWSSIATGIKKVAPIAMRIFKPAAAAFAKTFEGAEGKLGKRALAGLKAAGKAAGREALKEAEGLLNLRGKGLEELSTGRLPARDMSSKSRLLMRRPDL